MFDALLSLLCGCRHRNITRPITPVHRPGTEPGETYVACLECGKQFHYDLTAMRMGTPIPRASNAPGDARFQASCG